MFRQLFFPSCNLIFKLSLLFDIAFFSSPSPCSDIFADFSRLYVFVALSTSCWTCCNWVVRSTDERMLVVRSTYKTSYWYSSFTVSVVQCTSWSCTAHFLSNLYDSWFYPSTFKCLCASCLRLLQLFLVCSLRGAHRHEYSAI